MTAMKDFDDDTHAGTVHAPEDPAVRGVDGSLTDLVDTVIENLDADSESFSDALDLPELRTSFENRQALIVIRGQHYKEDLAMLKSYIREYKPVLVGVDGGADALLEAGYTPDLIIGDLNAVTDNVIHTKAELVAHRQGTVPDEGEARLDQADLAYTVIEAPGTNEDLALLIADTLGAQLIVAVGSNYTVTDFVNQDREDIAATFLTRLRVGSKLVDAKGVALLYRRSVGSWYLIFLALAGLFALGGALFATAAGQTMLGLIAAQFDGLFGWIHSLFAPAQASQNLLGTSAVR